MNTIKDIARLAGVSVGTVSKILNDQGNVKPALRLRVEAVIEKVGYRPSAIARSFKKKQTRMIGIIIPRLLSQLYVELVHHVEKLIKSKKFTLFVGNAEEDTETEIAYLHTFANLRVDGLILSTSSEKTDQRILKELDVFKTLGIPVVIAGRKIVSEKYDTVTMDYRRGAYEAARYVIEQGHRRIAILSAPEHSSVGMEFYEGYLDALNEAQVPFDKSLVYFGNKDLEKDYQNIVALLNRTGNPPTAILTASNFRVMSILKAVGSMGKKIPEDISVICFGDTDWFSYLDPPLTAVEISSEKLAENAVRMLFDRIEKKSTAPPVKFVVPVRLILRNSVKSLKPRGARTPSSTSRTRKGPPP